ncbi:MAG: hypothetical protein PUH24_00610 [Prevotellaceae bacterium]|nr:hypothetical protein [Prevotella sp.]MDD7256785.1 hypothetical protein [Prevotellaceae bacterium]
MMKKMSIAVTGILLLAACQESLEEKADRECREYTEKYCPAPISEMMVVDSMVFEKNTKTVHYYYSLKGFADSATMNVKDARLKMLDGVKNSPSLMAYKEAGFNFKYTYHSTKNPGKVVYDFLFTPADYNKKTK